MSNLAWWQFPVTFSGYCHQNTFCHQRQCSRWMNDFLNSSGLVLISCIMVALGGWVLYIDQKGNLFFFNSKLNSCSVFCQKKASACFLGLRAKKMNSNEDMTFYGPRLKFHGRSFDINNIKKITGSLSGSDTDILFLPSQLTYFGYVICLKIGRFYWRYFSTWLQGWWFDGSSWQLDT